MAGLIQAVVSSGVTILVCVVILAGVYKLFQIATDLSEMKDVLRDIKRNTQSPEDFLRSMRTESYSPEAGTAPTNQPR